MGFHHKALALLIKIWTGLVFDTQQPTGVSKHMPPAKQQECTARHGTALREGEVGVNGPMRH